MGSIAALETEVGILRREVQAREAFITSTSTGYDGDPNDGAAPIVFQNAPLGVWYHRAGVDLFYRKNGAGVWELSGAGSGEGATTEPLTLIVDPSTGSDPVASFKSQADVDGHGSFATLQGALDALPAVKAFDVTTNLVAGEIPPQATLADGRRYAHTIDGIWLGRCIIQGADYTIDIATQTVTATVDNERPELQCSGTPFAGRTLNGRQCRVTHTDASSEIVTVMENTDSSIFIRSSISSLSGTPQSVEVLDQGSILSEYLPGDVLPVDDQGQAPIGLIENRIANSTREDMVGVLVFGDGIDRSPLVIRDVRFRYDQGSSSSEYAISSSGTTTELERCLVDHDRMPGNLVRGFCNGRGGGFYARDTGFFRGIQANGNARYLLMDGGFTVLTACSFHQIPGTPEMISADSGSLDIYSCLFERCGQGNQPLISAINMVGFFFTPKRGFASTGYENRIRDPNTGVAPVTIGGAPVASIGFRFDFTQAALARSLVAVTASFNGGNTELGTSVFNPSSSLGMILEGAFSPDYIVSFIGFARGVTVRGNANAPVGAVADIQGVALPSTPPEITWAELIANGPYVDELGNLFSGF